MADVIQLLSEHIANQIAAGEVIQRPASAVKELMENAIDAGATEIQLVIKDAGKELIQVIDNGKGMSPTDARMSFERHATSKIQTTRDLAKIIENIIPRRKIHPATKVFQALRIYVNNELENIKSFLVASLNVLNPEGRLVCISFHSLEDRIVKQFFKANPCIIEKGFKILTPKVIQAQPEEIKENPSSRSAKLRAAQICVNN